MNPSVALLLVVLLFLGAATAGGVPAVAGEVQESRRGELWPFEDSLDGTLAAGLGLEFDFASELDADLDSDLDLAAGHQAQAEAETTTTGGDPRTDADAETPAMGFGLGLAVGVGAAEEFLEVGEGQGRRKLPTSCTTAGVAACFASAGNGDEIETAPGTLSSWDGIHSNTQLWLANKYVSIACSADGGACVWQGATGKGVVNISSNGGTSTLSHLVVKDGDYIGNGGGLSVFNSNVDLTLIDFIDNAANRWGGAIFVENSGSSTATLHGCSFAGNTSTEGPDVYNNFQTVVIGGCPAGEPIRLSLLFPPLH